MRVCNGPKIKRRKPWYTRLYASSVCTCIHTYVSICGSIWPARSEEKVKMKLYYFFFIFPSKCLMSKVTANERPFQRVMNAWLITARHCSWTSRSGGRSLPCASLFVVVQLMTSPRGTQRTADRSGPFLGLRTRMRSGRRRSCQPFLVAGRYRGAGGSPAF